MRLYNKLSAIQQAMFTGFYFPFLIQSENALLPYIYKWEIHMKENAGK